VNTTARIIAFSGLLALSSHVSFANDAEVKGAGGSWRPADGENASVQMVRERVRIDVYRSRYRVTAEFEFANHGPAITVHMGFPERGDGDGRAAAFRSFVTTVDGRRAPARRVLQTPSEDESADPDSYQALWIKRVSFRANQKRLVRVTYYAEPGGSAVLGPFASYDFEGMNWKGAVEESEVTVTRHAARARPLRAIFAGKPIELKRAGETYSYRWQNWEAQGNLTVFFDVNEREWQKLERATSTDPAP
jgi:hypothetical protein